MSVLIYVFFVVVAVVTGVYWCFTISDYDEKV